MGGAVIAKSRRRPGRFGRVGALCAVLVALAAILGLAPLRASAANSYFSNSAIADVAERSPEYSRGGQCMRFVHNVLWTVSGHRINTSAYRDGYQGTFKAAGGTLIANPAAAVRGDIIQITPLGTPDSWKGPTGWPLHTTIVRSNRGGGAFDVIDSNFHLPEDELVRRRPRWNPYSWVARQGGGIVKIWRLGSVPAASPPKTTTTNPTTTTGPPKTTTTTAPDRISNDASLIASKNQYLRSADGRYRFVMQSDSNLVLYGPSGRPLWASNTVGRGASKVAMQGDGNLVIYTGSGKPIWASNTERHYHAYLVVQNDGNVVIYEGSKPLWATNTAGRT